MSAEDWRSVERRNMVVGKLAETIRAFPSISSPSTSPREIENTIYMRANNDQEYMNMVGRIMVSIRNRATSMQANMPTAIHPQSTLMGAHLTRPLSAGGYNPQPAQNPYVMQAGGIGPMAPGMAAGHQVLIRPRMVPSQMVQTAHGLYPAQVQPTHPGQMMDMRPGMHNFVMGPGTHTIPHQYTRSVGIPPGGMPMGHALPQMVPGPQPDPYHPVGGGLVTQTSAIRPPNVASPFSFQNSPGGPSSVPPSISGPPSVPTHSQPHSPAAKPQPGPAPSPTPAGRGLISISSPNTPWTPSSPAHTVGSPGPPAVPPEANEAYLRKLEELRPYIPLLARMIDKMKKSQSDDTRTEQFQKMDNLYSLLQDKNRRVPLQTLDKCERALKKLFENHVPAVPPSPPVSDPSVPPDSSPRPPPVPAPPVPTSSMLHFNMLHSPLPLSSSLLPTLKASEDPLDRLSPEQRAKLCPPGLSVSWDGKDTGKMVLKRELSHLKQFSVKQLHKSSGLNGSIELECSLLDNGLPSVPPITVHIPWNYPSSSPVCQLSSYQSDSSTAFLREVALLLGNQLTCCQHNYSLSFLLGCWENSVLEVTSKEINSEA